MVNDPYGTAGGYMFKFISVKSISATGAAAVIGTFAAFLTPIAPEAIANVAISEKAQAKGDRLPILVTGRGCSVQSWPNYDRGCQFDLRRSADDIRQVRIVKLER